MGEDLIGSWHDHGSACGHNRALPRHVAPNHHALADLAAHDVTVSVTVGVLIGCRMRRRDERRVCGGRMRVQGGLQGAGV